MPPSPQRRRYLSLPLCAAGLSVMVVVGPAGAATPSFLCSQASTWVEKTICGSERLSDLDLELAMVYARLLRTTAAEAQRALTGEQRRWWSSRDECRRQGEAQQCLESRYLERIGALRARPDYTEARPGPVELPPEAISAVGQGWSRSLSAYIKAIRACLRKAPGRVARIGNAWPDAEQEQAVTMRMQGADGEIWVCTARRNGSEVMGFRATNAYEPLPAEGPLFYPDPAGSPANACGTPVQVLDEYEAPVGWIGPACAPGADGGPVEG